MEQMDLILLSVIASTTSILLLSLKLCFKSKCSECALCYGCIKMKRDNRFEAKLEAELKEKNGQKKLPSETIGNAYPSEINLQQLQQAGESNV
jgi:hypothetical protein